MATASIHCAKCGVGLERMEDAYAWFDRPVCKACFRQLSATRGVRYRAFWMPLALGACAVAIGLAITVVVLLTGGEPPTSRQAAAGPPAAGLPPAWNEPAVAESPTLSGQDPTPAAPAGEPSLDLPPVPPTQATLANPAEYGSLTREQVLSMLRADRTWYWHWERQNRDRPLKFVVNSQGRISTTKQPDSNYVLEQRWVLLHEGHIIVPVGPERLRGFFIRTGRPVGMYTDEKLNPGK